MRPNPNVFRGALDPLVFTTMVVLLCAWGLWALWSAYRESRRNRAGPKGDGPPMIRPIAAAWSRQSPRPLDPRAAFHAGARAAYELIMAHGQTIADGPASAAVLEALAAELGGPGDAEARAHAEGQVP